MIICPVEFYLLFKKATEEFAPKILENWFYPALFTKLMRDDIFRHIEKPLNLKYYQRNYYTLDGIFYAEKDKENFKEDSTYAHSISVAIEYENNYRSTMAEMNKLQLFNVPLKVLVTYPESKTGNNKELLEKYAVILQKADIFNDFTTHRRQLVIFGTLDKKDRGKKVRWEGHVYSNKAFGEISV